MLYCFNVRQNLKKIKKAIFLLISLLIFTYTIIPTQTFAGGFNVELNVINTPNYPPTAFVLIPYMQAYVAESSPYPIFYVERNHYYFHDNVWYFGTSYNGPWQFARVIPIQLY